IVRPTPSKGFLKTVCLHLDRHRLITTKVEVIAPNYVGIGVNTTLRLRRGFSEVTSQEQIDRALQKFLHPFNWANVSREPLVYSLNGATYTFDPANFHEDAV
ncbi:MAG: hypothetical protein ACKPA7_22725, partial [Sphaerospermopsis kisseleviana]